MMVRRNIALGGVVAAVMAAGLILSIGQAQDSAKPAPAKSDPAKPDPAKPAPAKPESAKAQPQKPPVRSELAEFMRKKLTASNEILEGLCTEDMELVIRGAESLNEMSSAERWQVRHDVMYKQASSEFRQITLDLKKAAEEKNADRAMVKWLDATVSCMDCHRFVRGMRIVDAPSQ